MLHPILQPVLQPVLRSPFDRPRGKRFDPISLFANGESGGWWTARDQFSIYQYYSATYAARGSDDAGDTNVAFALDRSTWGGATLEDVLGPNVVVNGGFDADTNWGKGEGWSIADGVASRTTATGASNLVQSGVLTIGKTYLIRIKVIAIAGANLRILAGSGSSACYIPSTTPSGTVMGLVARCGGSTSLFIQVVEAGGTVTIDDLSCQEIPGAVAYQGTNANCPAYQAGGYVTHDENDSLVATFAQAPGLSTVLYSTIDGITIVDDVDIGTSYTLPTADWFDVIAVNRSLTERERASVSSWLLRERDVALRRAISIWGDSYAVGSGANGMPKTWGYQLQGAFPPPGRPRKAKGVGGSTVAQMRDRLLAENAAYRSALTIFWDKRNTSESAETWLAGMGEAIAALGHQRFVILSPVTATGEGIGSDYYAVVQAINSALLTAYPDNFIDIRSYLVGQAIYDAGITPTEDDLADMSADTIPRSLLADAVHLNAAAQALVVPIVAGFISAKGW